MRLIAWSLISLYLAVVGLWPAAAAPVNLAATGAFTVLAQPAVLLAAAVVAIVVSAQRRPAPAYSGRH